MRPGAVNAALDGPDRGTGLSSGVFVGDASNEVQVERHAIVARKRMQFPLELLPTNRPLLAWATLG